MQNDNGPKPDNPGMADLTIGRRGLLGVTGAAAITGFASAFPGIAQAATGIKGRDFRFAPSSVPEGFLLDGKPFQIRSGEMHPARIPARYWRHRIQMAKALGLNTIGIYTMWNYLETAPGVWDFKSENRDIARFIRLCAEEGMYVFLRPGPYVCAEWDWGGLPPYLLRDPKSRARTMGDKAFMEASRRYVAKMAEQVRPLMFANGGPILMVQVENEYCFFGNDPDYLPAVRQMWLDEGINGPFSTGDPIQFMIDADIYLKGAALGMNGDANFPLAKQHAEGAPTWVTEGYTGWITHWGDKKYSARDYRETMKGLMKERRSFNLYVVHGGTNFGFTAGANSNYDGSKFEPTITSYDYGAPINENGLPTEQYHGLRKTIYSAIKAPPLPIPAPIPTTSFAAVPTRPVGSLWGAANFTRKVKRPEAMELQLQQDNGLVLYAHDLAPGPGGQLYIEGLADEALVLLDGEKKGWLSRVKGSTAPPFAQLPDRDKTMRLEILVFPYGRVNFGDYITDRKGILEAVKFVGEELTGWDVAGFPLDANNLRQIQLAAPDTKPKLMHQGQFTLPKAADTFLDMKEWGTGFIWVNGHSLGRHSNLGPQTCYYCPANFLKPGVNTVLVLDIHAEPGLRVGGIAKPDDRS